MIYVQVLLLHYNRGIDKRETHSLKSLIIKCKLININSVERQTFLRVDTFNF